MKIRRYLAKNNQEAILKVKMDLGNDALILNTRKVKPKGFFGVFSKPMVEVLAAIDEYGSGRKEQNTAKNHEKPAQQEKAPIKDLKTSTNFDEKEEKITTLENKISNMEELLQKICTQMVTGDKNQEPQQKEKQQTEQKEEKQQTEQKEEKQQSMPPTAQIFFNNLIKNEVEVEIARKVVDSVLAKTGSNAGMNDSAAALYSVIAGILGKTDTININQNGKPSVAIFVGPTGVGKTTTLAKIAANYLLNQKKTVGLITADTYRIAAVEQLKIYGEILGVPVTVAYTPGDVKDAVLQHSDKDIILIDTAGRSHRNKTQFDELKTLIDAAGADEVYLVLSATTSIRNCREILDNYDFLSEYKLIFTKTDEAPVLGVILNVKYLTGKKLSYITNGQSVPDDIEVANIERITKNLIGSIG